ncbi:MAG TPA: Crp/Fnr family transcriptional regulator [Mesorhizobium sp.]|jgi:CRP-like cAMP-binding protein|nr:Crp/Fnr family transcriptional regulator [Mesorhizobium sp.]
MSNALIRKLEGFGPLREDDRQWLDSITNAPQEVAADVDLIREGDNPEGVHLILEGLAARYKLTTEGQRQLFAFLIPGDFCDLHVAILKRMDHSIVTLSPCKVVFIRAQTIRQLTEGRPALLRAFWWCALVDEATLREWLVNLGQRRAELRIAHLFCELHVRMKAVGLTTDGSFELPLTQVELGDTVGLSTVHVNRTLKELREAELVTVRGKRIVIPDVARLRAYSGCDPASLHLREHEA